MQPLAASDIIPCVYKFLLSCGFEKAAKSLQKEAGDVDFESTVGLSGRGLLKICKNYVKQYPDILEEMRAAKKEETEEEESEEEEEVVVLKPKSKKDKKAKKNQDVEDEEEAEAPEPKKKVKKTEESEDKKANGNGVKHVKKGKSKFMVFEHEEEEEEDPEVTKQKEAKIAARLKAKKEAEEKAAAEKAAMEEETQQNGDYENGEEAENAPKFFSRTDYSKAHLLKAELRDNTFDAKHKFGAGGDEFGQIGWDKLKHTRGKDFKKEKNKLKNKNFHGGDSRINTTSVNSIKF